MIGSLNTGSKGSILNYKYNEVTTLYPSLIITGTFMLLYINIFIKPCDSITTFAAIGDFSKNNTLISQCGTI